MKKEWMKNEAFIICILVAYPEILQKVPICIFVVV